MIYRLQAEKKVKVLGQKYGSRNRDPNVPLPLDKLHANGPLKDRKKRNIQGQFGVFNKFMNANIRTEVRKC